MFGDGNYYSGHTHVSDHHPVIEETKLTMKAMLCDGPRLRNIVIVVDQVYAESVAWLRGLKNGIRIPGYKGAE